MTKPNPLFLRVRVNFPLPNRKRSGQILFIFSRKTLDPHTSRKPAPVPLLKSLDRLGVDLAGSSFDILG
jgi:hypothetical protein